MVLLVLSVLFVVTLLAGVPIAFSTGIASLGGILAMGNVPLHVIVIRIVKGIDSFPLMAIPFFILAGEIMAKGGVTDRLVNFADILVGKITGGLAQTAIVGSMIFAGITGSATADTSAIGSVLIPAMKKEKYDEHFTCAVIAAAAVIGPIIPPSLTFVIYSLATGVSIGGMFVAGIVPGVLVGLGLMAVAYVTSKRRHYPRRSHSLSWREIYETTKTGIVALLMPLIIVGGILGGIFTATEAAAAGAFYALVVCRFVLKTIRWRDIPDMFFVTAKISSIVLLLLGTTNILSWVLTINDVGKAVVAFFLSVTNNVYVFLALVNVVFLIIGMLVDTFPAILIMAPLLHPVAVQFGLHPLHFGVVICVNLLIGLITPPVGTNLFVICAIGKVRMEPLTRAVIPFLLVEIIVLFVISYVPILTLYIPKLTGFY
jgi:tripartite ATP-independent transporter DctM subunit